MTRPLIHVGFQKTGTTYLQAHVFNDLDKGFASRWTVESGEAIEHFVLTHERRFNPAQARAAFDSAHEGLPANTVPVLSHEDLSGHPVLARYYGFDTARRLRSAFPDARIMIGIREQRSMLRSLYGQYIRQDGEWPIERFLGKGDLPPGFETVCRLEHFEYHLLVDYYVELFGAENVLIMPIEMLRRDQLSYEQAIHDFAGTGAVADRVHELTYVGLGAMTLALHRKANVLAKVPPDWTGKYSDLPLAQRAKGKLLAQLQKVIPRSWHKKHDQHLKSSIAERVGNYFARSNRRLAERYGLPLADLGYDLGNPDADETVRS